MALVLVSDGNRLIAQPRYTPKILKEALGEITQSPRT